MSTPHEGLENDGWEEDTDVIAVAIAPEFTLKKFHIFDIVLESHYRGLGSRGINDVPRSEDRLDLSRGDRNVRID